MRKINARGGLGKERVAWEGMDTQNGYYKWMGWDGINE